MFDSWERMVTYSFLVIMPDHLLRLLPLGVSCLCGASGSFANRGKGDEVVLHERHVLHGTDRFSFIWRVVLVFWGIGSACAAVPCGD